MYECPREGCSRVYTKVSYEIPGGGGRGWGCPSEILK